MFQYLLKTEDRLRSIIDATTIRVAPRSLGKFARLSPLLGLILNIGFMPSRVHAAGPIVWTASSLGRIWQNSPAGSSTNIKVYAARNETYSFQIGIQGALTNVTVTTSGLTGPTGALIFGSNIALFREQYISVGDVNSWMQGGPNPAGRAGMYPDGLIPFVDPETGLSPTGGTIHAQPFTVAVGTNQVIWTDIYVPAGTPAGDYTGRFTVSSDQGSSIIQATMHVWNFTLPVVPTYKSSLQAFPPTIETT